MMALLFILLGLVGVVIVVVNLSEEEYDLPKKILFVCIGILIIVVGFGVPAIGNNTPIATTHYSIITDHYAGMKFSAPVRVEYDIYKHALLTYQRLTDSDPTHENITITIIN